MPSWKSAYPTPPCDWSRPAADCCTEQDTGRVTLMDRRILTRRYGRAILDSLPPFRRELAAS